MKIKLDENLGRSAKSLLQGAGHDVMLVREQDLSGAPDSEIYRVCCEEARVLITLDHDFSHVLRFPPERSHGIVILELPPRPTPDSLLARLREFLALAAERPIQNELWIVEPGRVRVHERTE